MGIITQYNYVHGKWAEEEVSSVSETQPDQSYTIQELLLKFATGTGIDAIRQVHYDQGLSGKDIDADFERYDPTDDPDFDMVDAFAYKADMDNRVSYLKDINRPNQSSDNTTDQTSQKGGVNDEK